MGGMWIHAFSNGISLKVNVITWLEFKLVYYDCCIATTAFLSRSPRLLNRGPGGSASLGHGPHSSNSPTDWDSELQLGLVGWHINHCGLFNAKSSLYIYIKYIWFGLVGFYVISTIVGYLMPNPLYTYVLNIYDLVWFGFMAYQPL